MEVKVLGTGCPRCKRLEQLTAQAAEEAGIPIHLTKVTDLQAITAYPIVGTPGLVINEEVKSSGRLPSKNEIIAWLQEAQSQ